MVVAQSLFLRRILFGAVFVAVLLLIAVATVLFLLVCAVLLLG
jgi:hypothetical protein